MATKQTGFFDERDDGTFITSFLDDFGLTPTEFRLYAHLSRRVGNNIHGWPAIDSMAKVCRMNDKTVRSCLNSLIGKGMVRRESRPGHTSLYYLTHRSKWVDQPLPKEPMGPSGTPPKVDQGYPSQSRPGEGNALEGNALNSASLQSKPALDLAAPPSPTPPLTNQSESPGCPVEPDRQPVGIETRPRGVIVAGAAGQPAAKESWLTAYSVIWESKAGGKMPFGVAARVFKALESGYGRERVLNGWRAYVKATDAIFMSIPSFASKIGVWLPKLYNDSRVVPDDFRFPSR